MTLIFHLNVQYVLCEHYMCTALFFYTDMNPRQIIDISVQFSCNFRKQWINKRSRLRPLKVKLPSPQSSVCQRELICCNEFSLNIVCLINNLSVQTYLLQTNSLRMFEEQQSFPSIVCVVHHLQGVTISVECLKDHYVIY